MFKGYSRCSFSAKFALPSRILFACLLIVFLIFSIESVAAKTPDYGMYESHNTSCRYSLEMELNIKSHLMFYATEDTLEPTFTFTPSSSFTPSETFTPSSTFTPSDTFTPSNTFTNTPTFTSTPVYTDTLIPTTTPTITDTLTHTATKKPAQSDDATPTPVSNDWIVYSVKSTTTQTKAITETQSVTAAIRNTDTSTNTIMPLDTATSTKTSTPISEDNSMAEPQNQLLTWIGLSIGFVLLVIVGIIIHRRRG